MYVCLCIYSPAHVVRCVNMEEKRDVLPGIFSVRKWLNVNEAILLGLFAVHDSAVAWLDWLNRHQ